MPYTHGITHPHPIVEENVNFFADYFVFLSSKIGEMDCLSLDNALSLSEDMLFQIETNFENCPEYLKSILSHPIYTSQSSYLNTFKSYTQVKDGFDQIIRLPSSKQVKKWLVDNPVFISDLQKFQKELNRKLYKVSLIRIIELLKEIDDFQSAREQIQYYTSVIVTELIFKGKDKKQLDTIFKSVIKNEDKIGFDNQFLRLEEIFHEKPSNDYFIYRIDGLDLEKDIVFKYNKVTFYSTQNKKFDFIKQNWNKVGFYKDFFAKNGSLAVLKLEYFSKELAGKIAVKIINKELSYINHKLRIHAVIRPFIFLHTPKFHISAGSLWNAGEDGKINKLELEEIEASAFNRLKGCNKDFYKHFLIHEFLFGDALQLDSPHAFWNYLEALLTPISRETGRKTVEIVTNVLLTKYIEDMHWEYIRHLSNTIVNDHVGATKMRDDRYKYSEYLRAYHRLPLDEIESLTQHPLVNYLTGKIRKLENDPDYLGAEEQINRIVTDIKAQRNSMVHNGLINEKRIRSISDKTPNLIHRFRNVLIEKAKERNDLNFIELFKLILQESDQLLKEN